MIKKIGKKIGIVGSGQLGRMMAYEASLLNYEVYIYGEKGQGNDYISSAGYFARGETFGDYNDIEKIVKFVEDKDYITFEFEGIDYRVFEKLEEFFPEKFNSSSKSLYTTQNRLREKTFLNDLGIETAKFNKVENKDDVVNFVDKHQACIVKTTQGGYDGKGQYVIRKIDDINEITFDTEIIAESFVDFEEEFSLILTRAQDAQIVFYPIVKNEHTDGILSKTIVKREYLNDIKDEVQEVGKKIADNLNFVGTIAVEFFLLKDDKFLVNEIAPRPHNSGHFTMDLCSTCQFENHIRAATGLPLKHPILLNEGYMLNLIGDDLLKYYDQYIDDKKAKIHLYNKEVRKGRKVGHVNVVVSSV